MLVLYDAQGLFYSNISQVMWHSVSKYVKQNVIKHSIVLRNKNSKEGEFVFRKQCNFSFYQSLLLSTANHKIAFDMSGQELRYL